MAYVKEKGAHSIEVYTEDGLKVATIHFEPKINAATRPLLIRSAAESWQEGRTGVSDDETPVHRKAAELRNELNAHIQSSPDFGAGKQRGVEKQLFKALKAYVDYFKDPANRIIKRDPTHQKPPMLNRPPDESWRS